MIEVLWGPARTVICCSPMDCGAFVDAIKVPNQLILSSSKGRLSWVGLIQSGEGPYKRDQGPSWVRDSCLLLDLRKEATMSSTAARNSILPTTLRARMRPQPPAIP